jgi:transposase-like protein
MAIYAYRHVFANERTCYWMLHRLRWPRGVTCPKCSHRHVWRMNEKGRYKYRCKKCLYHFSLLTGTALQKTQLPLTKWVLGIALFKVGISSHALGRELQISQRIAWRMLQAFRLTMGQKGLISKLRGSVEVDETYIGGRHKGLRGRGAAHKTIVMGFRTRRGQIRTIVVPCLKTKVVRSILEQNVAKGTQLYTDSFRSYNKANRWGFKHRRINHTKRFARGKTHTQGIEGYWGHLKPQLMARHRSISPENLPGYLAEHEYKHNTSKDVDFIQEVLLQLLRPARVLPVR